MFLRPTVSFSYQVLDFYQHDLLNSFLFYNFKPIFLMIFWNWVIVITMLPLKIILQMARVMVKKKKAALYLISLYQYLVPLFASPLRRQSSPTSTSRFSRSYGAASISDDSGSSPFSFQTPAELIPRDIFSTCHTSFDTKIKCCLTFEVFYLFRCT